MDQTKPCIFEQCERSRADQLQAPICGYHAQRIYLEVKDLMASASTRQREASIGPRDHALPIADRHYSAMQGRVYFARCGDLIKIGFSTRLRQRLLKIGADELLLSLPGKVEDEKALHARFGPLWDHGEYFRPGPELLSFIESQHANA